MNPVEPFGSGVRLTLHVQPRASRTELAGVHGDAIKVRVSSPPVEGAANAELVRFLARTLQVPRGGVRLVAGAGSRRKVVEVSGVKVEDASVKLGLR